MAQNNSGSKNNNQNPKKPANTQKNTPESQAAASIAKLEKERKQLLTQIAQIKKNILNYDKDDIKELEKVSNLEKTRKKTIKEYHEISQKISKLRKEEFDRLKKMEKMEKDQSDRLNKDSKTYKNIRDYNKELEGIQEKSTALMRSMTQETQNQAKLAGLTVSNTRALAEELKDANIRATQSVKVNESFSKTMQGTIDIAKELDSIETKIAEGIDTLGEKQYEMIDLYQTERDLKQQIALVDLNQEAMGKKRYAAQKNILQSYSSQLQRIKAINKAVAQQSQEMYKSKQSAIDTEKALAGAAAAAPATSLYKKMEIEKTNKGVSSLGDKLRSIKDKIKAAFEFTFNMVSSIFSALVSMVKWFFDMALELDKVITKVGTTLNVSRKEATKITEQFGEMAMQLGLVGVNAEQFLETLNNIADSYGLDAGRIMKSSMDSGIIQNMTILREKFQLTNEQAQSFFEIGAMAGLSIDNMVMRVDTMSKGLMNSRTAMKALANVPKQMALNMKNSYNDLVRFAIKAKLLGMDMDQLKSTGDLLMDIEASLEKQMESEVITGVHIKDMDKIRLAFYEGDIAKAMDMLDASMGSTKEFRNLRGGTIGQKAFAEQFGMTPEKLAEYLTKKDALKQLGLSMKQAADLEKKNFTELQKMSKQAEAAGNKQMANYLLKLAKEKENAELTQKYEDYMTKVRFQLMKATLPVLERLHEIMDTIINSGVIQELLEQVLPISGDIANMIGEGLDWVVGVLKDMIKMYKDFKNGNTGFLSTIEAMVKTIVNTIAKLLGFGDIFTPPSVDKRGGMLPNDKETKSFADGLEEKIKKAVEGGIKDGLGNTIAGLLPDWKILLAVVLGLLGAVYLFNKIGGRGAGKKSNFVIQILAIAGAIWILSDAARKFKESGIEGSLGIFAAGGALYLGAQGLRQIGRMAKRGAKDMAIGVAGLAAVVGSLWAIADATEKFSRAMLNMAETITKLENVKFEKVLKVADALDEFGKKMSEVRDLFIGDTFSSALGPLGKLMNIGTYALGEFVKDKNSYKTPLEKIVDFINSVNMNRIMSFSGTLKHLAVGLKELFDGLKQLGSSEVNLLWSISKASEHLSGSIDKLGNSLEKKFASVFSNSGKLQVFFAITQTVDASKIVVLSNALFFMAKSIDAVANALNRVDINKLGKVSLKMQGQDQKQDTGWFGSIARKLSSGYDKVKSWFGGETSNPSISVNTPSYTPMSPFGKGNSQGQNQTVSVNTEVLEKKMDTIISVLNNLSSKTAQIKFGERFIEEVSIQLNGRRDLDATIDNSAGRMLKR